MVLGDGGFRLTHVVLHTSFVALFGHVGRARHAGQQRVFRY